MSEIPSWTTSCRDWARRIVEGRSLIPLTPLFPDEAESALKIFRGLRIVDAPNRPTMAEACLDWVFDFVGVIFGAYHRARGRMLIRYFFLLISKKNSKSTIAAGIMLTALLRNWRDSGEYYVLAPTKEIADNVFFPARDMVRADEELSVILHVKENERIIVHRTTKAFLKVIAADSETVSGKKTIGLLVEEFWLFGERANAANMIREAMGGLASRPEGFVIFLSTQGDKKPAGVFAKRLERMRKIRDGEIEDPRSLPLLYEFPDEMIKSEAFKKPENWRVTNPNLGKSVDIEYLNEQLAEAKDDGTAALVGFYAKHLNVQVGTAITANGWAGAVIWAKGVEPKLTLTDIITRCEVICVGVDGGGLDDLLGIAVIGRERGTKRWLGWAQAMVSTIGVRRRKANADKYLEFQKAGDLWVFKFDDGPEDNIKEDDDQIVKDLIATALPAAGPGEQAPDLVRVVDIVKQIQGAGLLAGVGVDRAGIGGIVDALAEIGVTQDEETLDAVQQGIALMGAIKTIERKLADRTFVHGGSEMLSWCVGNLIVVPTATAMRVERAESGYGKVDPIIALFDAAHLMSLNPGTEEIYSGDREIRFI